jgi:hypothetical protein
MKPSPAPPLSQTDQLEDQLRVTFAFLIGSVGWIRLVNELSQVFGEDS